MALLLWSKSMVKSVKIFHNAHLSKINTYFFHVICSFWWLHQMWLLRNLKIPITTDAKGSAKSRKQILHNIFRYCRIWSVSSFLKIGYELQTVVKQYPSTKEKKLIRNVQYWCTLYIFGICKRRGESTHTAHMKENMRRLPFWIPIVLFCDMENEQNLYLSSSRNRVANKKE